MILLSNGGQCTFKTTARSEKLCVGHVDGVTILSRKDDGWGPLHRGLEGIFVAGLTMLSDGALIAATHGVGIARSDDGGATWQWINDGLTQLDCWAVRSGVLGGREVVLAGTLPSHLFMSEDGGASWVELTALRDQPDRRKWFFPPVPHQAHVKDIVVYDEKIYVGIEVGALLMSTDRGKTFAPLPVDEDLTEVDIHRIAIHPQRPNRIIISNGLVGMMSSQDGGVTWTRGPFPPGLDYPEPLVLHPDDPDLVYVAGAVGWPPHWYSAGRARGKIARSRDGGCTWELLLGGLPSGQRAMWGALSLESWARGFELYAADTDGQIFESQDGGDRWEMIGEVGPVSKGDFHRGLAKGRQRIANVDDMMFHEAAAKRIATTKR